MQIPKIFNNNSEILYFTFLSSFTFSVGFEAVVIIQHASHRKLVIIRFYLYLKLTITLEKIVKMYIYRCMYIKNTHCRMLVFTPQKRLPSASFLKHISFSCNTPSRGGVKFTHRHLITPSDVRGRHTRENIYNRFCGKGRKSLKVHQ